MAITTKRREQRVDSLQPALFGADVLSLPARHVDEPRDPRPLPEEGGRSGRLFSLTQRRSMQGDHERQSAPDPGKRYAASIVVSRPAGSGGAPTATVTIGELPIDGGPLLVVDHARDTVDGRNSLAGIVAAVERTWGCLAAPVIDGPEARYGLAEALRTAAANGGVHVYRQDHSQERHDFEAQIVGARARTGGGRFTLDHGPQDDAYVLGLGLLLRAAERVAPPVRRAA